MNNTQKNLSEVLEFLCGSIREYRKAKADDGKVSRAELFSMILKEAPHAVAAFAGLAEIPEELDGMDKKNWTTLSNKCVEWLDLKEDETKARKIFMLIAGFVYANLKAVEDLRSILAGEEPKHYMTVCPTEQDFAMMLAGQPEAGVNWDEAVTNAAKEAFFSFRNESNPLEVTWGSLPPEEKAAWKRAAVALLTT